MAKHQMYFRRCPKIKEMSYEGIEARVSAVKTIIYYQKTKIKKQVDLFLK